MIFTYTPHVSSPVNFIPVDGPAYYFYFWTNFLIKALFTGKIDQP